jgi:hypothetical protein
MLRVAFVDPVIVVPSDEKEREWWADPMNQLEFVLAKTYLKEFIMFEEAEDNWGVAGVVNVV